MGLSLEKNILNRIIYLDSKDQAEELSSLWAPKHLHSEELALLSTARLADMDFQKELSRWNPDIELRPKLKLNCQIGIVVMNNEGQVLLTKNEPRMLHLDDEKGNVLDIRVNSEYSLWKEEIITDDFKDIYNLVCVNAAARILKIEHLKKEVLKKLTSLISFKEKIYCPIFAFRVKKLQIEGKNLAWVSLKGLSEQKGVLDEETEKTLKTL